ncbi:hypothetical protein AUJ46_05660 [Candidatus Peregrinibacteria bacterium CG1_02_54_53]|nr:MAG: hypothetical protein AUJ46_05660 [Candidatus Peregrinibacteria bacterium CG1_02_54_53]
MFSFTRHRTGHPATLFVVRMELRFGPERPSSLPESGNYEPPATPVRFEIKPYTTQKIEGRISIENREVAMPVSMSVAKFLPSGDRETNLNNIPALDPQNPVWVVVHGRIDSESSDPMRELAQSLTSNNVQVVTLDWSQGAKDNFPELIGLQGSDWIEAVGKWTSSQLKAAGFTAEKINLVGHSWGSYVSYEIAKNMGNDVNVLVALDPAKDTILSGYDESQVDFAHHSQKSFALHSSFYGDETRALTADYAIQVVDDAAARPSIEHGYAVTAFSSLLQDARNPYSVAAWFAPQQWMGNAEPTIESRDGWDSVLHVNTWQSQKSDGSAWWKAMPQTLEYTDTNTGNHAVDQIIGNDTIS